MKKYILFSIVSLFFLSFTIFNSNHFSELVEEKLKNYELKNTPEKIYIHTDKPYYALDGSIWYSVYLVNGITHEKNLKSWVVYVELVTDTDSIIAKKKLFTNNISVAGDFKIGKNWKTGNYLIRAYTSYMQNHNQDYFFQKEINILDSKEKPILNKTTDSLNIINANLGVIKPNLNFYPEGGYLIDNVRSKIAIKIKNEIYANAKLSGVIVDEQDNLISEFKTVEFGLGAISLSPEPNKSYFAKLDVNGAEYSYKLPKSLPTGYALNVTTRGNYLMIDAKSTTTNGLSNSYLVAHQRGKLIYNNFETENKKAYSIKCPIDQLKDGVVHITLFDGIGNPVSERLVFISNPQNKLNVEITKSKDVLEKRKQIKINLNVKDNNDQNITSHLSMSVRDLSAFPHNTQSENIKTWLLLNSDLRGEIKNPGYFFDKENDHKRSYLLDLVMLTHGWRRFTWNELLFKTKKPDAFPVEKGIMFSGTTKNLNKPYTAIQTETRLSFLGPTISQEPIQKTDLLGRFSYGPFIFPDSIQILIESRLTNFNSKNIKDRNVLIFLNQNNKSPEVKRNIVLKNKIDSETQLANFLKMTEYINQINAEFNEKTQHLNEIVILAKKDEKISERNKEMNARADHGSARNRIDLENENILGSETIFDFLYSIPGVRVINNDISIRGSNGSPTVLLDNLIIDMDFLSTIDITTISFIDVLTAPEAGRYANSSNGVLAVYTKTGSSSKSSNVKRKPGIIDFTADGFYTAREFYAPDHINGIEELSKADIRTTLHWEPQIILNDNTGKEITFFSSDTQGDFLIEIEGISESGIPIYAISTFSVN